jgi:uncharacterized protein YjbI with pentapeptide repeats
MKRIVALIVSLLSALAPHAQPSPTLTHTVAANGDLTLTWPIHVIQTASTNLRASYQVEIASELNSWAAQGPLLRGGEFPTANASVQLAGLLDRSISFVRIKSLLDFAGGNFARKSMQDAPLTNALFTGANFFDAVLDGALLDNANLSAVDFRFASMTFISARDADFTLARLADADLNSADLRGAKLILAELSGAGLDFADLTGADLRGAILQDIQSNFTRFHETTVDPTTIFDRRTLAIWLIVTGVGNNRTFTDVDLTFADLSGGNLSNSSLAGLDLSGVDFRNVNLSGANLTNTILRLIDLRGTIIDDNTNLTNKWRVIWDVVNNPRPGRTHIGVDFTLAFWDGTTFERANISSANFNLGLMSNVNFESATATGARFTGVDILGANFKNADLRNAIFTNARLENVTFLGANIAGANFTGATFTNTTMPDGTIRN